MCDFTTSLLYVHGNRIRGTGDTVMGVMAKGKIVLPPSRAFKDDITILVPLRSVPMNCSSSRGRE